jgi:hypothetical protein
MNKKKRLGSVDQRTISDLMGVSRGIWEILKRRNCFLYCYVPLEMGFSPQWVVAGSWSFLPESMEVGQKEGRGESGGLRLGSINSSTT